MPYGQEFITKQKGMIYVDSSGGSPSLKSALESANSGDTVLIGSGTYTDYGVTLSNPINIVAVGRVLWQASEPLFTLETDGIIFAGTFKDSFVLRNSGSGQLANVGDHSYKFSNLTIECDQFNACNGVSAYVVYRDVKIYSKTSNGFIVSGGVLWFEENTQFGEPMTYTGGGHHGLKITGTGHAHFRKGANIYSDSGGVDADGGTATFYSGNIIAAGAGGDSNFAALYAHNGGGITVYEGMVNNNSSLTPTVAVTGASNVTVHETWIKSKGGSNAITSTGQTGPDYSNFVNNRITGTVSYHANDTVINNQTIPV